MSDPAKKSPEEIKKSPEEIEFEKLEAENEVLSRRAKIVELRANNEALRKALDKKIEETFLTDSGARVPVRFKGTIKYRVIKQIYRPKHGLLEPGETIELTDEVPSKALKPIKDEKVPPPSKPQQASTGRAANQQT